MLTLICYPDSITFILKLNEYSQGMLLIYDDILSKYRVQLNIGAASLKLTLPYIHKRISGISGANMIFLSCLPFKPSTMVDTLPVP
jgi:hypothetical protein